MATPPTGPCRLCGTVAKLEDSHIFSRWAHVRTIVCNPPVPGGPSIGGDVARIADGKVRPSKAATEYMLCRACEQLISKCEGVLARLSMQDDGSFPTLRAVERGERIDVDPDHIVRFAAACLWRASASRDHFHTIKLNDEASRGIAAYLLGEREALPDDASLTVNMFSLENLHARVERSVVTWPSSHLASGVQLDQFTCFGIWFRLYTGGLPTQRPECFSRSRRIGLGQEEDYFRAVVAAQLDAVAVGGMRKFLPLTRP